MVDVVLQAAAMVGLFIVVVGIPGAAVAIGAAVLAEKWQARRDQAYVRRCVPCDCSGPTKDPHCPRHGNL